MHIQRFDTAQGRYHFEDQDLLTLPHAHPALELIVAQTGCFTLATASVTLRDIRVGFVAPHQVHTVSATDCRFELVMVEPGGDVLPGLLALAGRETFAEGIGALDPVHARAAIACCLAPAPAGAGLPADPRIRATLEVIARRHGVASLALAEVASVACLSPSRYSHLFKAEMGISYQAYLNWTRLKTAIRLLLRDELNLTAAALEAGFYDTAHFSRQFKAFLGVNPGAVYDNSRIVQAGAVQDV